MVRICYDQNTGKSKATLATGVDYNHLTNEWYKAGKAACSVNLLQRYTCSIVWSDWTVGNGEQLTMSSSLGIPGVYTDAGGAVEAGAAPTQVVAMDYFTDELIPILTNAVKGSVSNEKAYLIDDQGYLIVTSTKTDIVTDRGKRIKAEESEDFDISTTAE